MIVNYNTHMARIKTRFLGVYSLIKGDKSQENKSLMKMILGCAKSIEEINEQIVL